jgi:cell division protein FtsQ
MDGGRRLLQTLRGAAGASASSRPVFAGTRADLQEDRGASISSYSAFAPRPYFAGRRRGFSRSHIALELLSRRGVGAVLALAFLGVSVAYGVARGGHYEAFTAQYGTPADAFARSIGLGLDQVTITGSHGLTEERVLQVAGLSGKNSLLFLDIANVRERLREHSLVKDVRVRKLYPDQLLIEFVEREPFAVWQRDGQLVVVSVDGYPIQEFTEDHAQDMPFVVGPGANQRVAEYLKIVAAAGDLSSRIRAGVLVGERRWTIKMTNGLDVKLPESEPEVAIAQFAKLNREQRIMEKDLVSVDMRVPGRIYARLTEEAMAAREAAMPRRKKGGQS